MATLVIEFVIAREREREREREGERERAALEATQGQMDGFFSQFPYKFPLEEVASVGD